MPSHTGASLTNEVRGETARKPPPARLEMAKGHPGIRMLFIYVCDNAPRTALPVQILYEQRVTVGFLVIMLKEQKEALAGQLSC